MPATITQGTRTVSFQHNTEHQRIKQVAPDGTRLYIHAFGVTAELFGVGSAAPRWNEYLSVGNVRVGMRVKELATTTVSLRYFHTDHLGSISVITNESGVVVERLSYDAWGKRRHPNGADDPTGSITSQTSRGFTGHEELDSVGLVHMNGRVYDALVGRMISADPTVPDPMNAQAWNRYSYVGNDPLAFTDPSGFSWLSSFFRGIKSLFAIPILRSIVQIAITTILSPLVGPFLAAAAGAAIVTGLSGGNLGQMLRAGAIAAATAFAFAVVGGATNVAMGKEFSLTNHTSPAFGTSAHALNIGGHAAVGCLSSVASGGSCQSGALSGAAGAAATPLVNQVFDPSRGVGDLIGGTAATGVVGGLASVAGGGKFENGAITAAFGYMYNNAAGALRGAGIGGSVGAGAFAIVGGALDLPLAGFGRWLGMTVGAMIGDWATGPDVVYSEGNKLPDDRIIAPPPRRGAAPIGDDGYPVELHHRGQNANSPLDEMTRTDHRLGGNHGKNHANTGQSPSNIDRTVFNAERRSYWAREWDSGRW
jgi:RHS repeat-associated protein